MFQMLQSYAVGKRYIQIVRSGSFNVSEYEKFGIGFQIPCQLTFKKLPLVEFWYSVREEYPKLPENLLKYFSLF